MHGVDDDDEDDIRKARKEGLQQNSNTRPQLATKAEEGELAYLAHLGRASLAWCLYASLFFT